MERKETALEKIARECAGDLRVQAQRVVALIGYHESEILVLRGALAMLEAQSLHPAADRDEGAS